MEEYKENSHSYDSSFWEESTVEEDEDDDSTLSLCHFSMVDDESNHSLVVGGGGDGGGGLVVIESPRSSFEFEFINPQTELILRNPDFLFCRPDPVYPDTVHSVILLTNGIDSVLSKDRSDSLSFSRSLKDYSVVYSHVQKVNITTLTTMSPKSRRRMFMFGPVKFKPEMELSAIKERQRRRRRVPNPMFSPAAESGETVAIGGGGSSRSKKRKQWKFIEALTGRAHFSDLFAKSCGCFPLSATGVRKLIAAAD